MTLVGVVLAVIRFYEILILIYVVMSWFVTGSSGAALAEPYRVLGTLCEPYIGLFRRILPIAVVGGSGVDFSPLVAILVLQIAIFLLQVAL